MDSRISQLIVSAKLQDDVHRATAARAARAARRAEREQRSRIFPTRRFVRRSRASVAPGA
jgi:hypothetical protein